VNIPKER